MDNIAAYHRKQVQNFLITTGPHGNVLGKGDALASVGLCPRNGALVSTVLMTVVPAKVAGVKRVVVATPETKHGDLIISSLPPMREHRSCSGWEEPRELPPWPTVPSRWSLLTRSLALGTFM